MRPHSSYTYNPDGYRSSKTVDGIRTNHIWNGTQIVAETNADSSVKALYIYGVKRLYNEQDGIKSYYLYDAHGDTKQLTNSRGFVTWDYTYDAFGNEISLNDSDTDIEVDSEKLIIDNEIDFRIFITDNEADNGNSDTDNETAVEEPYNPFRYCGEYFDEETGFIYLRARYYDPTIGRFILEDTHWSIDNLIYGDKPVTKKHKDALELNEYTVTFPDCTAISQSRNLYGYCSNNPIIFVDQNGEFLISTTLLVVAGLATVGAVVGGIVGNHVAEKNGATGWKKAGYIAANSIAWAAVGATAGYIAAPAVASATGVAGISVTTAGVSTIATTPVFSPAMEQLYQRTAEHIFSSEHIANGIMNLGKTKTDIFAKIYNVAMGTSSKWSAGPNEIRTAINGIETTVRFFVKNNEIININAFVGYSKRTIGNLIK